MSLKYKINPEVPDPSATTPLLEITLSAHSRFFVLLISNANSLYWLLTEMLLSVV